MTYSDLFHQIREIERRLAPGNETGIYGDFVESMSRLGGRDWRESEEPMSDNEINWWVRCYELYEADRELPDAERVSDVQEIYDSV